MCTEVTNRVAGIITEDTGESTELCREDTPTDPWVLAIVKLTLISSLIYILLSLMTILILITLIKTASYHTYIHIINNVCMHACPYTILWNSLELDIGELFINTLFIKYSIKTNNKNNSILMLTQNQSI